MPRRAIGNCLACKLPIWGYETRAILPDGRLLHTSRPDEPTRLGCHRYRPQDTQADVTSRWLEALRKHGMASAATRAYSTADPLGEFS